MRPRAGLPQSIDRAMGHRSHAAHHQRHLTRHPPIRYTPPVFGRWITYRGSHLGYFGAVGSMKHGSVAQFFHRILLSASYAHYVLANLRLIRFGYDDLVPIRYDSY